jgi:class 3 adenylate cyclase/tetratricopeptide (TPR) repeat protein
MRFCGDCGAALSPPPARRHDGDLHRVSIVFSDLVGSTELARSLDPEALRDLLRRYQRVCLEAVEANGGSVVQYIGDGVLAAFGAHTAREDAARRAVEAALRMTDATEQLVMADGTTIRSRAAVHTGVVVVGSMGAGASVIDVDLTGEAVNTSARLQTHAEPGTVIVSDATADLIAGHFTLSRLGELELKGVKEPIVAHAVLDRTNTVDRLSARLVHRVTPFVGRHHERAIVLAQCLAARPAGPRVVVFTGEAGIGKSRLVRELRAAPELEGMQALVLQCHPDRAQTPFGPILHLLASGEAARAAPPANVLEALGPRPDEVSGLSADQHRVRSIATLRQWLLDRGDGRPLLLTIEDLQWADPSTIELLDALVDANDEGPVVLLVTARPEWSCPWAGRATTTVMPLSPLADEEVTELLHGLGVDEVEPLRHLVRRAEGVPLYLEEIAALALRHQTLREHEVPASIDELLTARLAAAGDNEFSSECSVLGVEVDVAIAAETVAIPADEVRDRLERLVRAGILDRRPAGDVYVFRHGLLRDAAYGMLLRSVRLRVHEAAASALEEAVGRTRTARSLEAIALHWEAAERADEASVAWHRAARDAARRSAFVEAAANYEAALHQLRLYEGRNERDGRELAIVMEASEVCFHIEGASERMRSLSARAEELTEALVDAAGNGQDAHFAALCRVFAFHVARPNYGRALEITAELAEMAQTMSTVARVVTDTFIGATLTLTGRFEEARAPLTRGLERYKPAYGNLAGIDIGVQCAGLLAHVALSAGDVDDSEQYTARAFEIMEVRDDPFTRAWLLLTQACLAFRRDDRTTTHDLAADALALADAHGFGQIGPQVRSLAAWSRSARPSVEDIDDIRRAIREMNASGSRSNSSVHRLILADSLLAAQRIDEAVKAHLDLVAFCDETGERKYQAEIDRFATRLDAATSVSAAR